MNPQYWWKCRDNRAWQQSHLSSITHDFTVIVRARTSNLGLFWVKRLIHFYTTAFSVLVQIRTKSYPIRHIQFESCAQLLTYVSKSNRIFSWPGQANTWSPRFGRSHRTGFEVHIGERIRTRNLVTLEAPRGTVPGGGADGRVDCWRSVERRFFVVVSRGGERGSGGQVHLFSVRSIPTFSCIYSPSALFRLVLPTCIYSSAFLRSRGQGSWKYYMYVKSENALMLFPQTP